MAKTTHKGNGSSSKIPDKVRQQRESAEALAKSRGLHHTADSEEEADGEGEAEPAAPAMDLQAELRRIDEEAERFRAQQRAQLSQRFLADVRKRVEDRIVAIGDQQLDEAYQEMRRLEKMAAVAVPANRTAMQGHLFPTNGSGNGEAKGTRVRRPKAELEGMAQKLVDFLRDNPGSKGSAVVEGAGIGELPKPYNVKSFLAKWLPSVHVTTEGAKASTVYSLGK